MLNQPPLNRSTVAKDWHARGFSCGMWIDHAGREWSYQAQETDELFMMVSGKLEVERGGELLHPAVGEEIRISRGTPYTIRNIGGKTARWLYGHQRETRPDLQAPVTIKERSFHPEVKRKRRPARRTSALEVPKGT